MRMFLILSPSFCYNNYLILSCLIQSLNELTCTLLLLCQFNLHLQSSSILLYHYPFFIQPPHSFTFPLFLLLFLAASECAVLASFACCIQIQIRSLVIPPPSLIRLPFLIAIHNSMCLFTLQNAEFRVQHDTAFISFPSLQTLTWIPFNNSFAPKFIILDGWKTGYSSDGRGGKQFEEVSLSIC